MADGLGGIHAELADVAADPSRFGMTAVSRGRPAPGTLTQALGAAVALLTMGCRTYYYEAKAYFANTTREPVTVRVLELQAEVSCRSLSERSGEALAHRELFGQGKSYEVGPGEALPLSLSDESDGASRDKCAVLLQMLGQPDRVVAWPRGVSAETQSTLAPLKDEAFRRASIRLEGAGAIQGLAFGDALEVTPLPPASSGADEPKRPEPSFGWSGLVPSRSGVRLWKRESLPDGCLSVELGPSRNEATPLYLCLPDWAFPFEVEERLSVTAEELAIPGPYDARGSQARHLELISESPPRQLELWLNASVRSLVSVDVSPASGAGYRTPCGGYADPLTVTLPLEGATLTVGDVSERQTTGYRRRALLGRADEMLVAPDDCGDDYGALGTRLDLLTLEEWENTP